MKTKLMLIFVLCLVPISVSAENKKMESNLPECSALQCKPSNSKVCQCYCAAKGGPRDWLPGDPGYVPTDEQLALPENANKEKLCYCQQWDFDNAPVAMQEEADQHIAELRAREGKKSSMKKTKSAQAP